MSPEKSSSLKETGASFFERLSGILSGDSTQQPDEISVVIGSGIFYTDLQKGVITPPSGDHVSTVIGVVGTYVTESGSREAQLAVDASNTEPLDLSTLDFAPEQPAA